MTIYDMIKQMIDRSRTKSMESYYIQQFADDIYDFYASEYNVMDVVEYSHDHMHERLMLEYGDYDYDLGESEEEKIAIATNIMCQLEDVVQTTLWEKFSKKDYAIFVKKNK